MPIGHLYLRQITGWIDEGLNERAYIIPGLGDFGERRYCVWIDLLWFIFQISYV